MTPDAAHGGRSATCSARHRRAGADIQRRPELDSATVGTGIADYLYSRRAVADLTAMFNDLYAGDGQTRRSTAPTTTTAATPTAATPTTRTTSTRPSPARRATSARTRRHARRHPGAAGEGADLGDYFALRRHRRARRAVLQLAVPVADLPTEFDAEGAAPIIVIGTTQRPGDAVRAGGLALEAAVERCAHQLRGRGPHDLRPGRGVRRLGRRRVLHRRHGSRVRPEVLTLRPSRRVLDALRTEHERNPMRTLRRAVAVAVLTASAVALSGCTLLAPLVNGGETTVTTHTDETVAPELEQFYKQDVTWKNCGGGYDCATLKAPVDWAAPGGEQIELAISRHKATGTSMGSLLINPGGPGGSGFDFAQGFVPVGRRVRQLRHHRVRPARCRALDADRLLHRRRRSRRDDLRHLRRPVRVRRAGRPSWTCARRRGSTPAPRTPATCSRHIDTVSVAHDMDMMRAVLGDEKLNYLGYSFGTYIGTVYAELFPEKVGRMVLDGAVSPAVRHVHAAGGSDGRLRQRLPGVHAVVPRLRRLPLRRPARPGARRGARARAQRRRQGSGEQRRARCSTLRRSEPASRWRSTTRATGRTSP